MASEMIGEVLKLSIVVTMVAVLSLGLYALLPDERVPYLEVEMSFNQTNYSIIEITHVGGDPILAHEVTIEIVNTTNLYDKKDYSLTELTNEEYWKYPQTIQINASTFLSKNMSEAQVSIIHRRSIIAIGDVSRI